MNTTTELVSMLRSFQAIQGTVELGETWKTLVMPAVAEAAFALQEAPQDIVENTVSVMYCAVTILARLDKKKTRIRPVQTISGMADLVATAARRSSLGSVPQDSQLIIDELSRVLPKATEETRATLIHTFLEHTWFQQVEPSMVEEK